MYLNAEVGKAAAKRTKRQGQQQQLAQDQTGTYPRVSEGFSSPFPLGDIYHTYAMVAKVYKAVNAMSLRYNELGRPAQQDQHNGKFL